MMRTRFLRFCGICAMLLPGLAQTVTLPLKDTARTPEGNFTVFHRSPATADDLAMPYFTEGAIDPSFVYRVQDRKGRSLLYVARGEMTIARPVAVLVKFYQEALGKGHIQETDAATGMVTLVLGTPDHFRCVTIAPREGGCTVRLERIQQFTIPPRVYTAQEQQVIDLLKAVTANYRQAAKVSYTMEQRTVLPAGDAPATMPPVLTWTVTMTPPAGLHVVTGVGNTRGMEITTADGLLRVQRQVGKSEERKIPARLTIEHVPELQDDPVAALLLGDELVTHLLDTLHMQPVKGASAKEQTLVTLSYPDMDKTMRLLIDIPRKVILRAETVITDEHDATTTIRTYTYLLPAPPVPAKSKAATPPPTSSAGTSAAVRGL